VVKLKIHASSSEIHIMLLCSIYLTHQIVCIVQRLAGQGPVTTVFTKLVSSRFCQVLSQSKSTPAADISFDSTAAEIGAF
jgi:hypothetical protein